MQMAFLFLNRTSYSLELCCKEALKVTKFMIFTIVLSECPVHDNPVELF